MANQPPSEGIDDDFFEQILSMPLYGGGAGGGDGEANLARMVMHHSSRRGGHVASTSARGGGGGSGAGFPFLEGGVPPLGRGRGLVQGENSGSPKLEEDGCAGGEGFLEAAAAARRASSAKAVMDPVKRAKSFRGAISPANAEAPRQKRFIDEAISCLSVGWPHNVLRIFDGHGTCGSVAVVPHPPAPRARVRAKRGQATNPHSIAERLRRERIAEKMRALQELVPNCNKLDRAAMLDEIVDYVKFLRLQVKVLSMSRLGGAGTFSQLAADIPLPSLKVEASEDGSNQQAWGRWSTGAGTEQQVAKLMEKDVGAAMRFLQSNALCIVPISLAASICQMHDQPGAPSTVKPDPGAPS